MSARTSVIGVAVAVVMLAGEAQAQRGQGQAQGPAQLPACKNLNYRGNFRLNGAQQYVARADAAPLDSDKRRNVTDALRNLNDAVPDRGVDQLTLWYYFGRAYVLIRDYTGADSAWTRVEQLADADCKQELARRRRNEWVPLFNQAIELMNSHENDRALEAFRRANVIYRGDPSVYTAMANIYITSETIDSAVKYLRLAATTGDDPRMADPRATAMLNAARLTQHRLEQPAAAESLYRQYLRMKPRDMSARTDLAAVLNRLGRTPEALAIYDSLLVGADSVESFELFEAGVILFQQQRYQQAARAFDLGLAKNPFHRDALFNLTNTYVAANDGPNALASARRLVAVDSLNRQAWQLLAGAFQRVGMVHRTRDSTLRVGRPPRDSIAAADRERSAARAYNDSTIWALGTRDSLTVEVVVRSFLPSDSTAAARGRVENLSTAPRPAFTFTLEFINAAGEQVTREVVEVPSLGPGASQEFNVTARGRGIMAYRYRLN